MLEFVEDIEASEVVRLAAFVRDTTLGGMALAVFGEDDDARRAGLPLPLLVETPQAFLDVLPRFDPARHSVVRKMVCLTPDHDRLVCIAANLLSLGVCLVKKPAAPARAIKRR